MEKHGRRLIQLEKKRLDMQNQLDKLGLEENTGVDKILLTEELRDILKRDLIDVNIRIRNLNRNIKKEVNDKAKITEAARQVLPAKHIDHEEDPINIGPHEDNTKDVLCIHYKDDISVKGTEVDIDEIDAEDDIFNPESEKLNTNRPVMRLYPKVPLPHSQPNWDRVLRVGRTRDRPFIRRTDWEGQFTGVEQEEEKARSLKECKLRWDRRQKSIVESEDNLRRTVDRQPDEKLSSVEQFSSTESSFCQSSTRQSIDSTRTVSPLVTPALAGNIIMKNFFPAKTTMLPAINHSQIISPATTIKTPDVLPGKKMSNFPLTQEMFTQIKSKSILVKETKSSEVIKQMDQIVDGGQEKSPDELGKLSFIKVATVRPKLVVTLTRGVDEEVQ